MFGLSSPLHLVNYGWSIHVSDRVGKPRPDDTLIPFLIENVSFLLIPSPFLSASVERVRPVYPALICDIKEIPE